MMDSVKDKILEYITDYVCKHNYAPTNREIAKGVNLKSCASVSYHISQMLTEGILETDADFGMPRTLRIPGMIITPPTKKETCPFCHRTKQVYYGAVYCVRCGRKL